MMTSLTILNDIVHEDFETSLHIQKSWGIEIVDLRNCIYGKKLLDLTDDEARTAARAIAERGMRVYCLSAGLFFDDIERGESHFRTMHLSQVPRLIELARILQPSVVRLLSAVSGNRAHFIDSFTYLQSEHPWVIPMYREAVDLIASAGFKATIENEVKDNIFTTPEEIVCFFQELDRPDQTHFTFDVQNLWLMGTFPTLEVYRRLTPIIGYYHVKGGMAEGTDTRLKWRSILADASWPVVDMTAELLRDGRCEAICLNPSHGEDKPGTDYGNMNEMNVGFFRRLFPEIG